MTSALTELVEKLKLLPEDQVNAAFQQAKSIVGNKSWMPNPGPQMDAYYSEADEMFFGGQAGGGKDLALDTPIPTPYGWSTMGELVVGDEVFDENGQVCRVVAKSEIFNKPAYKLLFSDNEEIISGPGHQWVTSTVRERDRVNRCSESFRDKRKQWRKSRVTGNKSDTFVKSITERNKRLAKTKQLPISGIRTTEEIRVTLKTNRGSINHTIDVSAPLELPCQDLPIDPYILGAWLGDGVSGGARLVIAEESMLDNVVNSLPEEWSVNKGKTKYDYGVVGGFKVALRNLGLLGNKHIPQVYLRGSIDQRLALLQGLMDTDGYCDTRGQCEFTQVKRRLTDDFRELLSSLGIKSAISEGIAKLDGRVIGPKYRIKFITHHPVFRLARKLIRQKRSGFRGTHSKRYIKKVECVGVVPTQCIQVDSPSHMYLCGKSMIPTHNSDFLLGLAKEEHEKALILRRFNDDARDLGDRFTEILGTTDGWNGQLLRYKKGTQKIDFSGCQHEKDKQRFKGKPHDLIGFDEIPDFSYSMYSFIKAWNRSASGKRCRVVCTGNPPTDPEGLWVIEYWAPWLDPEHPNPAKCGELRWFVMDRNDMSMEVAGPGDYEIDGEILTARSRTFIRSTLDDNPDLAATDYDAVLSALPANLRDAYRKGQFRRTLRDNPMQCIPAAWVKAAQDRWTEQPPRGIPQCAIGVDPAQGGEDWNVLAARHDRWWDKLVKIPGKDTPIGTDLLSEVLKIRRDNAVVVIDAGGGYGGTTYAKLMENKIPVQAHKGSLGSNARSTCALKYEFANKRTEVYWRFRELLDPEQPGGSQAMIPPDSRLFADLTAPMYKVKGNTIHLETKDDLVKRLGRSPDDGDAVVNSWAYGDKIENTYQDWRKNMSGKGKPAVIMSNRRKRRV